MKRTIRISAELDGKAMLGGEIEVELIDMKPLGLLSAVALALNAVGQDVRDAMAGDNDELVGAAREVLGQ